MSTNANIKASISINNAFTRQLLKLLAPEVKAINPKLNVWRGAEWVHNNGRDSWEFHGPDNFYWYGRADNAYDARYKGWSAWLEMKRRKAEAAAKPFTVSVDWIIYAHEPGAESQQPLALELCELADKYKTRVPIPAARADLVREVVSVAGLYSRSYGEDAEGKRRAARANRLITRGREWLKAVQS